MNKDQLKKLEADLWSAADKLRANSDLKSSEYATPVLGLIFLKFADNNYRRFETEIHAEYTKLKGSRREKKISDIAIEKCGFYLPDHARYEHLLNLPEEKNIAKALKEAMKAIEEYKPELEGVLPKDEYAALTRTDKTLPQSLLRTFADIPANATGDLFGQIYEYFLSEFARSEGQKGGEFFTPRSVVRLMVEIIEPHGGKVFDPACGSGGMFVQSAQFIAELTAYDGLIENNQRHIAQLEKMAEEIYREWFVRLRFPGYEKVKFVKGVPQGWEVRTLSSFASEIKKGVKKKNLSDDEKYIGLEHIPRRSISIKEWATADTVDSDKLLFQEGDILFCKIRPYLHKVALSHVAGACSSDTIVIRPKSKIYEGYLLFTVFSDTFIELATVASKGTKMPRADWGFLKKLELAVPNTQLLEAYQAQFDTLFSQIVNLLKANEALVTSRDLLFPRLISGKLSVENLDIQFPPGMEEDAHA